MRPSFPPRPSRSARPLQAALLGLPLLVLLPGAPSSAAAQTTAQATRAYDIAAGPLSSALTAFAGQAGIQLSVDATLTAGQRSGGVQGQHGLASAFGALLAGTGLEAVDRGRGEYTLRRQAQASPAATGAAVALPAVTVTAEAERETATGPVQGYVARRSAAATKTDAAITETPRSISVVTRAQMQDQAVQTVEDALRYTAGVDAEGAGYDLRRPWTSVRGFTASYYRDGVKAASGDDDTGYYSWAAEPYALERVEVLKGPSSILYGRGAPGGVINQISKAPTRENVREVGLTVGSHDRYQANFDLGGAIGENGAQSDLAWRLTGVVRDSKTQTDYGRDDRVYLAPALTWSPSAATSLTVRAEYLRDRVVPKSFYPGNALISSNPNGAIAVSRFIGEPGFDRYDREQRALAYQLRHRIDDTWTFSQSAHYGVSDFSYNHVFGIGWADDSTIRRFVQRNRASFHTLTIDSNLQGKLQTGPLAHDIVVGFDYQKYALDHQQFQFLAPGINPFAPVYTGTAGFTPLGGEIFAIDRSVQKGVYLQDQVRAGRWIVNAGLRHDQSDHRAEQLVGGTFKVDLDNAKTTYNLGLGYDVTAALMVYASHSTSFNPTKGRTFDLEPFKPDFGRQFELGFKWQPASDSLVTGSVFQLTRENVATADPDHLYNSVQLGEVRARGLELEARTTLARQIDLIASYTFLRTEVTQSSTASDIGREMFTPKHTAALWVNYRFADAVLPGLSASAGVRHQGRIAVYDFAQADHIASRTLVDAAIRYESGPVTYALNVANLFDRISSVGAYFNQRRMVQASAQYRW